MDMPKIMYVCEPCHENNPESCGHCERDEVRRCPDGVWRCEECYANLYPSDIFDPNDAGEYPTLPRWSDLPKAPELVATAA